MMFVIVGSITLRFHCTLYYSAVAATIATTAMAVLAFIKKKQHYMHIC